MKHRYGLLFALLLMTPALTYATPVTIGDLEWRQLTETQGYSWYRLASVCDFRTGACEGSIGKTEFSGWTWASRGDVGRLFDTLTPHEGGADRHEQAGSRWAPEWFSLFTPTMTPGFGQYAAGWTRTVSGNGRASWARVIDRRFDRPDEINNAVSARRDVRHHAIGAWMYRSVPAPVPEPGTFILVGAGLAGLMASRRRRSRV